MKLITLVMFVIVFAMALVGGSFGASPSHAQSGDQATIAAQATRIAELEATVKARGEKINAQRTQIAELRSGPTETPVPDSAATGTTSPYLGGNALDLLPPGNEGQVEVVLQGTYDGNELPLIVRNNSDKAIGRIGVSATARSAAGDLIAAGGDQGFKPTTVEPGGYSLGYVYFDSAALPIDATFEFDVSYSSPDSGSFSSVDLAVEEATFLGDRVVGTLKNDSDVAVSGPMGISVMCLDANGAIISHEIGFTDKDQAAPGETVPFQVSFYGGLDCTYFLVASSGYNF